MHIECAIKNNHRTWVKRAVWVTGIAGLAITTRILLVDSALFKRQIHGISVDQDLTSLLILAGIYMLLLSIPFLPGVELGIVLMCVVGSKMVMIIYLFTVLGLSLSFALGRWLPSQYLQFILTKLGLTSLKDQDPPINNLINRQAEKILGLRLMHYVRKKPYLVTGLLLNLPGNFILGGGGGIAMLSGLNHRISGKYFLMTVTLATLPLPLLVFLGYVQLERFL